MMKSILLIAISFFCIQASSQTIFYRSEYEKVGDVICDINHANEENGATYRIISGNENNYYEINSDNGIITIKNTIQDEFNTIHEDNLTISTSYESTDIQIVDAFDYFVLNNNYTILADHTETAINNDWTAYNNLWGDGDAIPNTDYRIATLLSNDLPNNTVFIWDTPSAAAEYGGASVWCYVNLFWGNRKSIREDLYGFPFKVSDKEALNLNFDYKQLFGNEYYKVAINMFFTVESTLASFSSNTGDFFIVVDQKGTWIPNYPVVLEDTTIQNKTFAQLYENDDGYERRRIIIKDNAKLEAGIIDLKTIFTNFANGGYLNDNLFVPNIQFGIEVTEGFGAVKINSLSMSENIVSNKIEMNTASGLEIFPNPATDHIYIKTKIIDLKWQLYSIYGNKIEEGNGDFIDTNHLISGFYILKINNTNFKFLKK